MTKYWPHEQGIELNGDVAYLFCRTKHKFTYSLLNKTKSSLSIDLLDNTGRSRLFVIVLIELEVLILDIVELNLDFENIKILNYKILSDLLKKSLQRFLYLSNVTNNLPVTDQDSNTLEIVLSEHRLLLEYLLGYLIFGSSAIDDYIFAFDTNHTPKEHVAILLENFVIQLSNLVVYKLLLSFRSLSCAIHFIKNNYLCNTSYISMRSIALFRNTLVMQKFIYIYFSKPKQIYNSRYKVWLISSNGLIVKYIYLCRFDDISCLSKFQLLAIFLMEIQDLVIPKLEKFFLILSKIIFYIIINFLGNSAIFCIRSISSGINKLHK